MHGCGQVWEQLDVILLRIPQFMYLCLRRRRLLRRYVDVLVYIDVRLRTYMRYDL
jgi:hypothetical protein